MTPATRPNQIGDWKKQALNEAADVFETPTEPVKSSQEDDSALLHEQIGL